MKKYLKNIVYYFLTVVDGVFNFLCSIFGAYPTVDTSTNFLLVLEMRRVRDIWDKTAEKRQDLEEKASQKFEDAKDTLDG